MDIRPSNFDATMAKSIIDTYGLSFILDKIYEVVKTKNQTSLMLHKSQVAADLITQLENLKFKVTKDRTDEAIIISWY